MSDFIFRTEEMTNEQIQEFYVENADDIATVQKLSSRNPVLLVGSRGVGKTFLFRVAQSKLSENFSTKKDFACVYHFQKGLRNTSQKTHSISIVDVVSDMFKYH